MLLGPYENLIPLYKPFLKSENNKYQGTNSHQKRTEAEALAYRARKRKARNKKKKTK